MLAHLAKQIVRMEHRITALENPTSAEERIASKMKAEETKPKKRGRPKGSKNKTTFRPRKRRKTKGAATPLRI